MAVTRKKGRRKEQAPSVTESVAAAPAIEAPAAPVIEAAPAESLAPEPVIVAPVAVKRAHVAALAARREHLLPELAQGRLAAIGEANAAIVQGLGEVGEEIAAQARQAVEGAVRTTRSLLAVRTVADLVEIQRAVAQTTFEGIVANSTRLAEIGFRTATRAFSPFTAP